MVWGRSDSRFFFFFSPTDCSLIYFMVLAAWGWSLHSCCNLGFFPFSGRSPKDCANTVLSWYLSPWETWRQVIPTNQSEGEGSELWVEHQLLILFLCSCIWFWFFWLSGKPADLASSWGKPADSSQLISLASLLLASWSPCNLSESETLVLRLTGSAWQS